jgi:hypothetical protein
MRDRNTEQGMRLMGEHIGHRLDQIIDKVERCYGRIYMSRDDVGTRAAAMALER